MTNPNPIILGLDLSTRTGWCVVRDTPEGPSLIGLGCIESTYTVQRYPLDFVNIINFIADQCYSRVLETQPDIIVIEEINLSKGNRISQKMLDGIHFALLNKIFAHGYGDKVKYVNTSEWRKYCGIYLTKEQRKQNQKLSSAARDAAKKHTKLDKKALGIRGKITKKHVAVEWANRTFNLDLRIGQNDEADSLGLAYAYIKGCKIFNGK
jgi:Holliday junction resolvasome RuvABC endonuclease subunit